MISPHRCYFHLCLVSVLNRAWGLSQWPTALIFVIPTCPVLSCPPFSLSFIAYATQLFVLSTVEHVFSVHHVFQFPHPALPNSPTPPYRQKKTINCICYEFGCGKNELLLCGIAECLCGNPKRNVFDNLNIDCTVAAINLLRCLPGFL